MPSIEEAWNLPISAEMSSRQQQQQQAPGGPSYKYGTAPSGPPPPYPQAQAQAKRFKVRVVTEGNCGGKNGRVFRALSCRTGFFIESISFADITRASLRKIVDLTRDCFCAQPGEEAISASAPQRPPPFYLSPQQLQTLHLLQQSHGNLTSQQQILLSQLQHQYRAMQQHQQQARLQQAAQRGLRPGQPAGYGHPQISGQAGVIKNYGIPQQPVRRFVSYIA